MRNIIRIAMISSIAFACDPKVENIHRSNDQIDTFNVSSGTLPVSVPTMRIAHQGYVMSVLAVDPNNLAAAKSNLRIVTNDPTATNAERSMALALLEIIEGNAVEKRP